MSQLGILEFFQSIRTPILSYIFLLITMSTETPVIVLFTVLMYWCINKKHGQRMLFALTGNIMLNTGIKEYIKAPRPIGTPGLKSLRIETATGYSFPSGHTQTATTFWTSLMTIFKNKWINIAGVFMILSVGVSRLYLAVHWPVDVIIGWILGIVATLIFIKFFEFVDTNKNYLALVISLLVFIGVSFILNSESYVKMLGLYSGFVLGYIVEDIFIDFSTESKRSIYNFSRNNKSKNRLVINIFRFIIGSISLGIVFLLLKYAKEYLMTFSSIKNNNLLSLIIEYVRYSVIVFYGVAGAPAIFVKIKGLN